MVCAECQSKYDQVEIQKIVGTEAYYKLANIELVGEGYYTCPFCQTAMGLPKEFKDRNIICAKSSCGKSSCRLCRQAAHSGFCKDRKEMLQKSTLEMSAMPCPFCLAVFYKDKHCDHVTCYVCNKEFCFACSAKRNPSMAHGNTYHRKHCPHYNFYESYDSIQPHYPCYDCVQNNKKCKAQCTEACKKPIHNCEHHPLDECKDFEDKCPHGCMECTRLKKLCPQPKDLVDGDIPKEEYPENLKFE